MIFFQVEYGARTELVFRIHKSFGSILRPRSTGDGGKINKNVRCDKTFLSRDGRHKKTTSWGALSLSALFSGALHRKLQAL